MQGLANVLWHYIEPEESVPLAEGVRVLAIPTPARLGNTAPKHAYRGTVKKILTRKSQGLIVGMFYKQQIIEILFDVGVRGRCVLDPFMVKHISSVCSISAKIQLKHQLFGVRVGNSAYPDALAIGKLIRVESIEGIDALVLAVPLHGIASRNSIPMDGGCCAVEDYSHEFSRVFDVHYKVAGRDLSAGFMDGEYCFQSLVHFTLVCAPLKILDGEFIHQLDFVAGYDEGNYGYWPEYRNDFKIERDSGLHFVLVYVAKEDCASDVDGWPSGLPFPGSDDCDSHWFMQRCVGKREEIWNLLAHIDIGGTDPNNRVEHVRVPWHFICHEGIPQATLGPTLKDLERRRLLATLAEYDEGKIRVERRAPEKEREHSQDDSEDDLTDFFEFFYTGKSLCDPFRGPRNSAPRNYPNPCNQQRKWTSWTSPDDSLITLRTKCQDMGMQVEVYEREHGYQQWTSLVVITDGCGKGEWRGTVCCNATDSRNASAYMALGALFPLWTPDKFSGDQRFLRTCRFRNTRRVCSECVGHLQAGTQRSAHKQTSLFYLDKQKRGRAGFQRCRNCNMHFPIYKDDMQSTYIGDMCVECGRLYTGTEHAFPNLKDPNDPDALLKCGACGKAVFLLLFPGHHTPRRIWDHDEQLFVSIGKEHTTSSSAAKCTECLTSKILRGSFPLSHRQWRSTLRTCRQCMKYLCSRCDEMQPAAMFGTSVLRNHRRSDRRTALICSTCKDNDHNSRETASAQNLKENKLKCSACDIEKLSDNFLVSSVEKYMEGQQTVESN